MTHHRKTAPLVSPQWPRHALGHACLLALAGFSSMAAAQTQPGAALLVTNASITTNPVTTTGSVWFANYNLTSSNSQFGLGVLDASNVGIQTGSSLTGAGAVPTTVSGNRLKSLAFGNTSLSTGGLSLLANTGTADGLLVVNLQSLSGTVDGSANPATVGPLSVSAVVDASSTFITQSGMDSADLSLNTNTLQASTQLNVSDIEVEGVLPAGYASTATGSSSVAFGSAGASLGNPAATPTPVAGTTGSVNLSSLQSTASAEPTATLSDSSVALAVSDTTGGAFSSAASVNGNALTASTGVNTATSVFRAEAGSAAWKGSVSVTNLQNAAAIDGTTDSLASVADSGISADLRNGAGQTNLTGALTLSDNQITANATGNVAGSRLASGAIAAGTAIVLEGSSDVTGTGSGTGTSVSLASGTAQSVADLTLVNAQANAASSFVASVADAGVTSAVDNLAGGVLTQGGNTLQASTTANLGGNLVSVGQTGSVSNITASVSALTLQSNRTLSSTASLTDSAVSAVVGIANAVPTGTVTLSENTLAATAEGNVGVTSVGLQAANLAVSGTLGVGATQGVTLNAAAGNASAGLGVVALSVQSNEGVGGSLTANNEGSTVSLSFNDQGSVADALDIQSMTATLSSNLLQASATANSASTGVTLSGTNGTGLSAAVGNSQRNLDLAVAANADGLSVGLTADAVNSSALALDSNRITAAATGNTASSRLDVNLANASGAASMTPFTRAEVWGASEVRAEADLALANAQVSSRADVTAAVVGSVSLDVGNVSSAFGPFTLSPSTLSLSSNTVGATVEVNRASNAMALEVGNLSGMATALVSLQAMSAGEALSSTDGGVNLTADRVEGSALTANSNTVSASTQGNAVANNVRLSGTTATGDQNFMWSGYSYAQSSSANTYANVSLANGQSSSGNTLSALVGNADPAAVTLTGDAVTAGAALSLADNRLGANTSVNSASNALALDITHLTGMTAGVASGQDLNGTSATAVISGLVSADTGSVTGSNITVSGNAVAASVSGNAVNNAVTVDAATVSAPNSGGFSSAHLFGTDAQGTFQVSNYQQVAGTGSADLSSISTGDVKITSGAAAVGSSALTLSDNSVLADTRANSASNALALEVTTLNAPASLASSQRIDFAEVGSVSTGNVLMESGGVTGSALTVSGNTVKSAALGNLVNNQVELAGTNATGASSGWAFVAAGQVAQMQADVGVSNLQNSNGIDLSALTTGAVGIAVDGVNSSSALTLSGNSLGALAQSNSASNNLTLDATNLSGYSAGVASSQGTNGAVSATATAQGAGAFTVTAGSAVNSPVVLSDNNFSAVAGMNEAFNTLTATGATLSGQSGAATSTVGNAFTDGVAFSVINAQSGMGVVDAVADPLSVGFAGALTGGSLSIVDNTVLARASVNTASNELTLAATNSLLATAVVNNMQEMASAVSALVGTGNLQADLGLGGGASTVSVSGNSASAQANGNQAFNMLNATAASGISSSGPSSQPTFAVLNQQRTQATADGISAVLNGTTLGAALNGTGGRTTVQGNQLVAMASGNSVDNVLAMSALPGSLNTARAAVTNVQYNMASISASVNGASVMGSGSVSGGGSVNVSGNTITAQVMGNRAVNSISAR
ncbi:MAG: hypothetical protein KGZ67_05770 [Hydrogenophaga sp.]|nr:hypothetical protein [Hydrogenophaga sp.]